jgi:hypothetical protein
LLGSEAWQLLTAGKYRNSYNVLLPLCGHSLERWQLLCFLWQIYDQDCYGLRLYDMRTGERGLKMSTGLISAWTGIPQRTVDRHLKFFDTKELALLRDHRTRAVQAIFLNTHGGQRDHLWLRSKDMVRVWNRMMHLCHYKPDLYLLASDAMHWLGRNKQG